MGGKEDRETKGRMDTLFFFYRFKDVHTNLIFLSHEAA